MIGAIDDCLPLGVVTVDSGVHTMALAVEDVRRLLLPLVRFPRVTVTTVRGMPETVVVVAVRVAFRVTVVRLLAKSALVFTEPRLTELPGR